MLLRRELISFPNNGAEREKPVSASAAAEEYKLAGRTWICLIFFSENTTRFETMSFRSSVLHHWLSCPLHPAACEGCGWAWSPFLTARGRGTRARGNWNISWCWKQEVLCCHSSNAGQNCCVCFSLWSFFFFFFTILDLSANQMYFLLIFSIVVDGRPAQGSWFVASSQGGNGSQEGCYVTYSPDPSSLLWIRQKSVPDVFVHKRWKMFRLVGQIQSSLIILEGGCCTLLNFEHSRVWKPF